MLPRFWDCSTSSDNIIALSLCDGGVAFFDTRTGNKIGSRISIPTYHDCLMAFSPDGKWIVIQGGHRQKCTLDLWNVDTRTRVKKIEIESEHLLYHITYSADGEKVMFVTWRALSKSRDRTVLIWDVKTDKPLKRLEVEALDVAISPDGSQIAIHDELGIKIIDVGTEHIDRQITLSEDLRTFYDSNSRIAWSPNGQFLASATTKQSRTKLYLLTRGSAQVPIITRLECSTTKYVCQLAFSPDSSKVVAVLGDNATRRMTLSI